MFALRIYVLFLLLQCMLTAKSGKNSRKHLNDEARLLLTLKRILHSSPNEVRPVHNTSEALHVTFGLALSTIHGMEEISTTESKLTASVVFFYTWSDYRLQWKPENFSGIDSLAMPVDMIWRPDIILFNNIETAMQQDMHTQAIVSSRGHVIWITRGQLTVIAEKETASWWSDGQWEAEFKFGSWSYGESRIALDFYDGRQSMDLSSFRSKSFSVNKNHATKNVKYSLFCQEPSIDLTFNLTLLQL